MYPGGETPLNTFLRHAEYYDMQSILDDLYEKSKSANKFYNLYDLIISEKNILLAFRTIKTNHGSRTAGVDNGTIDDLKRLSKRDLITHVRSRLNEYKPKAIKRVYIPKENGEKRPLGIPVILDRLIQQMFKQILEPIAEAQFYKHSYGFRPLRSAHHAIARAQTLINKARLHFVVDIDIKGFFDNVNHNRLMKQIWNLGIRDRRVLAIISKILKSPIKGVGILKKGVPQGGILSPLLANIVLHDLDMWIYSQWEGMTTNYSYKRQGDKLRALKQTNLKRGYLVRYADDFKVFTMNYESAQKWFHAIKGFLKGRLKLEISTEKSRVTNLGKKKSDFLGYRLKANRKGNKYVAHTYMKDKKKRAIIEELKQAIKRVKCSPVAQNVMRLNAIIMGVHYYFRYMTHVSEEFQDISFSLSKAMYNGFKRIGKYEHPKQVSDTYKEHYCTTHRTWKVAKIYIYPIADICTKKNFNYSASNNIYTEEGRVNIYKKLHQHVSQELLKLMSSTLTFHRSAEYVDNRLSRYSMASGKCEITGEFLSAEMVHCHHYLPVKLGGTDQFSNLRILHKNVHKLIHAVEPKIIEKYTKELQLNKTNLNKINRYRKKCNLDVLS